MSYAPYIDGLPEGLSDSLRFRAYLQMIVYHYTKERFEEAVSWLDRLNHYYDLDLTVDQVLIIEPEVTNH